MPNHWSETSWLEGHQRGYVAGVEEGHYLGWKALRSDLLYRLETWGTGLQLQLHGDLAPVEVWQEMLGIVERADWRCHAPVDAEAVLPCQQ